MLNSSSPSDQITALKSCSFLKAAVGWSHFTTSLLYRWSNTDCIHGNCIGEHIPQVVGCSESIESVVFIGAGKCGQDFI